MTILIEYILIALSIYIIIGLIYSHYQAHVLVNVVAEQDPEVKRGMQAQMDEVGVKEYWASFYIYTTIRWPLIIVVLLYFKFNPPQEPPKE
jgi:hypothetical protein